MVHPTDAHIRSARDKIVRQYLTHPAVTLIDIGIIDDEVSNREYRETQGRDPEDDGACEPASSHTGYPVAPNDTSVDAMHSQSAEPVIGIRIPVNDQRYISDPVLRDGFPRAIDGIAVAVLWGNYDAQKV